MNSRHTCPDCGAPTRRASTGIQLDPWPHPDGTVTIARWAEEPHVIHHARPRDVPRSEPFRYRVHHCRNAG